MSEVKPSVAPSVLRASVNRMETLEKASQSDELRLAHIDEYYKANPWAPGHTLDPATWSTRFELTEIFLGCVHPYASFLPPPPLLLRQILRVLLDADLLRLLRCSTGIALNTMGLFRPLFSRLGVNLSDRKALSW
jgi:hypothetical protein